MRYRLVEKMRGTVVLHPETKEPLELGDTVEIEKVESLGRLRRMGLEPAVNDDPPAKKTRKGKR